MRIVMHLDLDAFFASVEEKRRPALKGKPVVVGADPKQGRGRGVVSTANYYARKFGIHSGMPISRAYKQCPTAVFLPVDMREYYEVSQRVMQILQKYSDQFEQVSVDEAFLELTNRAKDFNEAKKIAEKIKREIRDAEGLSCSVGLAENKLVAKIASGHEKPDGLTIVEAGKAASFLAPLKPSEMWGIGPKTHARLEQLGVRTLGQLAKVDAQVLLDEFGSMGPLFRFMARGIDESPVIGDWEAKSVGREHTFEEDVGDPKEVLNALEELSRQVCSEITEAQYWFKTVTLKVRFEDFETHTHAKSLARSTGECKLFNDTAKQLIQPYLGWKKIRLIGIRASGLVEASGQARLE